MTRPPRPLSLTTKLDMPRKKRNNEPIIIDLCRRTRSGIRAFSPRLHCKRPNMTIRSPNPTNKPITLEEFHGRDCPPHCNARNKQQIAPRKNTVPKASICCNLLLRGKALFSSLECFSRRKAKIENKVTPPIGRLLNEFSSYRHIVSKSGEHLHPKAPSPTDVICECAP